MVSERGFFTCLGTNPPILVSELFIRSRLAWPPSQFRDRRDRFRVFFDTPVPVLGTEATGRHTPWTWSSTHNWTASKNTLDLVQIYIEPASASVIPNEVSVSNASAPYVQYGLILISVDSVWRLSLEKIDSHGYGSGFLVSARYYLRSSDTDLPSLVSA